MPVCWWPAADLPPPYPPHQPPPQPPPPTVPYPPRLPTLPAGVKYAVKAVRQGPQSMRLHLGGTHVDVVVRKLNDGGLLVQVGQGGRGGGAAAMGAGPGCGPGYG